MGAFYLSVVAITKQDRQLYNVYLNLVKANEMALIVKLADIEDNVSCLGQLTDEATKERLMEKNQHALKVLIVR